MNKSELKEKIFSSRSFRLSKSTIKFFITPIALFGSIFAFHFYKIIYGYLHPPRRPINKTPKDMGLKYEEVSFRADSPLRLRGWFIPARQKSLIGLAPTIILCHGYPSNRQRVLNRLEIFSPKYNYLLFDFRALGQSAGTFSSFGLYEQRDLAAAIKYLHTRDDIEQDKIGLFGFSMGGAVALMVAAEFPEIKAIVVESPYASLDGIIKHIFSRQAAWNRFMVNLTILIGRAFKVDLRKVSPLEAVKEFKIPLLIIHSRQDEQIPFEHSKMIFEAASEPKSIWAPANSGHGQIIEDYRLEYKQRVGEFFDKYLG